MLLQIRKKLWNGVHQYGIFYIDVKRENIRDWYLAFGFTNGKSKLFCLRLLPFAYFALARLLGQFVRTDNCSAFNGEMAFMFFLKRISSICTLMELEGIFGREHTQLSRLFDYLVERLYRQHSWLVTNNMNYFVDRFPTYNEKILNRVIPPTPER